jgi:hypothetical protein
MCRFKVVHGPEPAYVEEMPPPESQRTPKSSVRSAYEGKDEEMKNNNMGIVPGSERAGIATSQRSGAPSVHSEFRGGVPIIKGAAGKQRKVVN